MNIVARCFTDPSGATIIEPPSKTSSSWPPTAFTYAIHAPVWRARSRRIVSRSWFFPRWYGEPLMFTISGTPASRENGRPSCQASSHTVMPNSVSRTVTRAASSPGVK